MHWRHFTPLLFQCRVWYSDTLWITLSCSIGIYMYKVFLTQPWEAFFFQSGMIAVNIIIIKVMT